LIIIAAQETENGIYLIISPGRGSSLVISVAMLYRTFHDLLMRSWEVMRAVSRSVLLSRRRLGNLKPRIRDFRSHPVEGRRRMGPSVGKCLPPLEAYGGVYVRFWEIPHPVRTKNTA